MIRSIVFTLLGLAMVLPAAAVEKKQILFIAGRDSHGKGAHEHRAGVRLLAKELQESGLPVETTIVEGGYPEDASVFEGKDTVVIYCDGGGRHVVMKHLKEFDAIMKKGVGLVCIHYGVEVPKGPAGEHFKDWLGGYFEPHWSVNPHWDAAIQQPPAKHPVSRGLKPFTIRDEWYFHMRFRDGMNGVTPIFSAIAPDSTMSRKNGAHSGNPDVRKAVAAKIPQHVAWATERKDGGRGFGFTGGHFHKNWANDTFRTAMLNAIVWTAHGEVPANGVPTKDPDMRLISEVGDAELLPPRDVTHVCSFCTHP